MNNKMKKSLFGLFAAALMGGTSYLIAYVWGITVFEVMTVFIFLWILEDRIER